MRRIRPRAVPFVTSAANGAHRVVPRSSERQRQSQHSPCAATTASAVTCVMTVNAITMAYAQRSSVVRRTPRSMGRNRLVPTMVPSNKAV